MLCTQKRAKYLVFLHKKVLTILQLSSIVYVVLRGKEIQNMSKVAFKAMTMMMDMCMDMAMCKFSCALL